MTTDASILFDPAVIECPFPTYRTLRDEAPVAALGPDMFVVTRHDDVLQVLGDPARFSSLSPSNPFATFGPSPVQDQIDEILGDHAEIPTLLNNDPPDQARIRALVGRVFTPRQVQTMEPQIRRLVEETAARWIGDGRVDFASQFAGPLPSAVTAEALGAPADMRPQLTFWADEIMSRTAGPQEPDRQLEVAANLAAMFRYFHDLIDQRRATPRDDLLSLLVRSRLDDGATLTDHQIVNVAETFLVGGNETTTFLLTSTMHRLANEPELADRVRRDHGLIPPLVEEMLRLEAPSQGMPRWVTEDVELSGVRIPAGATVFVMFGSANRDEALVADPDGLHLAPATGAANRHLAFGHGVHFCLGAALARAEMRISLEVLLARMADIELAPGGEVHRNANPLLRGFTRLDLAFHPI